MSAQIMKENNLKEIPQVAEMEFELLGMMLLKEGLIIPTVSAILKARLTTKLNTVALTN